MIRSLEPEKARTYELDAYQPYELEYPPARRSLLTSDVHERQTATAHCSGPLQSLSWKDELHCGLK